jgi:hypothetical protein
MHATRNSAALKLNPACGRVMRGVMPPEGSDVMAQDARAASLGRA